MQTRDLSGADPRLVINRSRALATARRMMRGMTAELRTMRSLSHFARALRAVSVSATLWLGPATLLCGCTVDPPVESGTGVARTELARDQPFMWGVASSAFQSEGAPPDSNWTRYIERSQADPNNKLARVESSVDFRHKYAQDIQLARALGVNTYRIGIDWARVEPQRGQFDERELAYYEDVIAHLVANDIAPIITLDHWTVPGWIDDQGGWKNTATITAFLRYAETVVRRFGDRTTYWLTFNEAVINTLQETRLRNLLPHEAFMMNENLVAAHKSVYRMIHQLDADAQVSSTIYWVGSRYPVNLLQPLSDLAFLDRISAEIDYVALDYYQDLDDPLDAMHAVNGEPWKIPLTPSGIRHALDSLAASFPRLPILIAENGMPTEDGAAREDCKTRSEVLSDTVYWAQRAARENPAINLIGYLYWGLTDSYEWGSYKPRFGLYKVDVENDATLVRQPTDTVRVYHDIIKYGLPEGYAPHYPEQPVTQHCP
ncbi:MAG: bglA 1 [Myxococcaceae bacterium]|nr:bglA 1 [Myxococcaceae bacterium]